MRLGAGHREGRSNADASSSADAGSGADAGSSAERAARFASSRFRCGRSGRVARDAGPHARRTFRYMGAARVARGNCAEETIEIPDFPSDYIA